MRRILSRLLAIGGTAPSGAYLGRSALARHWAAEASDGGVWGTTRELAVPDASEVGAEDAVAAEFAPEPADLIATRAASPAQSGLHRSPAR